MDFIWYADVFFLTELLRNYFLLCLTAAFEKRNPFRLRLILAAAAVLMYLLVLRAENILNHYWGVRS